MYITRVCDKCDNNTFKVVQEGPEFNLICSKCGTIKRTIRFDGQMIANTCKKCGNSTYKFKEESAPGNINIDITCSQCGSVAEYDYINDGGKIISFAERNLLDIKRLIGGIHQRVEEIETNAIGLQYRNSDIFAEAVEIDDLRDSYDPAACIKDITIELKNDLQKLEQKINIIEL